MDNQIKSLLNRIEEQHSIEILIAIESGSRAWGFPSADSDYDIRFVYRRPMCDYLTVFDRKDTVDNVFDGELDAAGWDVSKFIKLMYSGNATTFEWLCSPIVYYKNDTAFALLESFSQISFLPSAVFSHYLGLTKKKLLDDKSRCNAKEFLYALRALLCAKWIVDEIKPPPLDANILFGRYIPSELQSELVLLLQKKRTSSEGMVDRIPNQLLEFLGANYTALCKHSITRTNKVNSMLCDKLFSDIVFLS